jgi:hypothetical protein
LDVVKDRCTGIWERLNNVSFNPVEFDGIRMKAGVNSFALTPEQWMEKSGEATCHGRGLNTQWQKIDRWKMSA